MVEGSAIRPEITEFVAALRQLRDDAGHPSLREMSRTAHYSHTALSGILAGDHLPSLDLTLGFVRACGGDEEVWAKRWASLARMAPGKPIEGLARPRRGRRRLLGGLLAVVALAGWALAVITFGT